MTLPPQLLAGYANFRSGRYASEEERYRRLGEGAQNPTIMVIACCDLRAAPETIFDAGPGEIFVVRNVANLVPPYTPDGGHHATSAALEFAVLSVGVKHIVIMGHGRCGGIRTAISDVDPLTHTDFIGSWMRAIKDVARLVPRAPGDLPRVRARYRASVDRTFARQPADIPVDSACARTATSCRCMAPGSISRSANCIFMITPRPPGSRRE